MRFSIYVKGRKVPLTPIMKITRETGGSLDLSLLHTFMLSEKNLIGKLIFFSLLEIREPDLSLGKTNHVSN